MVARSGGRRGRYFSLVFLGLSKGHTEDDEDVIVHLFLAVAILHTAVSDVLLDCLQELVLCEAHVYIIMCFHGMNGLLLAEFASLESLKTIEHCRSGFRCIIRVRFQWWRLLLLPPAFSSSSTAGL